MLVKSHAPSTQLAKRSGGRPSFARRYYRRAARSIRPHCLGNIVGNSNTLHRYCAAFFLRVGSEYRQIFESSTITDSDVHIETVSQQSQIRVGTPLTQASRLAELERNVIRERVVAGMDYARHHGTKTGNAIGRPRRIFDRSEVARLRDDGLSIQGIARQMRLGVGTVVRVLQASENQPDAFQKAWRRSSLERRA